MLQCVSINDCSADPTQGCATCATDNVWNCATCTESGYVVDDTGRVRAWFGWLNLVENKLQLGYGSLLFIGDWRGSCCAGAGGGVECAAQASLPGHPAHRTWRCDCHHPTLRCLRCSARHPQRQPPDRRKRKDRNAHIPACHLVCLLQCVAPSINCLTDASKGCATCSDSEPMKCATCDNPTYVVNAAGTVGGQSPALPACCI